MKNFHRYILVIIPLLYFSTGAYFHEIIGNYSVKSADPEYIFFINGLSIANGKFKIGNIDHPAIPFDYLVAVSMKITHIFRHDNAPFNEDVLANPEIYLKVVNLMMIIFVAIIIYLSGYLAIIITPNIWYALIIQFSPFATEILYGNIGRLTTEILLPVPVMFLSLMILKILMEDMKNQSLKEIFIFAGISALGLSMKLTFLPLLLIPLFIIKSWKYRIYFGISTILIFFIIALPVTLQLNYFINWIKSLFLHSGQYGKGENNIVNVKDVVPNLIELFRANRLFFITAFIFVISFLFFLPGLKKYPERHKGFLTGLSLIIVLIIQIFALTKHFKTHYFIVTLMLFPVMVILMLEYTRHLLPERILKIGSPLVILFIICLTLIGHVKTFRGLSVHFSQQNEQRMRAFHFFKTLEKNSIKIIVPGFYGAPIEEYALMTSYQWAGKYKVLYKPIFAKLYPDSYIFYSWDKTLNFWGDSLKVKNTTNPIYIYYNRQSQKDELSEDFSRIITDSVIYEKVFFNELTEEVVFRIKRPQ